MLTYFKKYFDKLYFSFIDYLFRKKSLNFIIYVLIAFAIRELTAISAGEAIARFLSEVKQEYSESFIYWGLRLAEVLLVDGSHLVLGVTLFLILVVGYLRRTEISKASSGEKFKLIIEGLEEKKLLAEQKLEEVKTEAEIASLQKVEYKRFLDKINHTLQEKNISKEELLKKVSSKLKAIILYKSYEEGNQLNKLIRDNVYPELGAVNIASGLTIIPPDKINQKLSEKRILEWFKNQVESKVPENYDYNFPIIAVVDLTKITAYKRLKPFRRINRTYLDKIRIEDLISLRELESYLYQEKNISSKEVIEIASVGFLIDSDLITTEEYERIKKDNSKIISEIHNLVGVDQLKTTQFANLEDATLNAVLSKYVSNINEVILSIKNNAQFWKEYFDRKL